MALVAIGALVSGKALLLIWLLVPIAGLALAFAEDLLAILMDKPNFQMPRDESEEEHIEHYQDYVPMPPGNFPDSRDDSIVERLDR